MGPQSAALQERLATLFTSVQLWSLALLLARDLCDVVFVHVCLHSHRSLEQTVAESAVDRPVAVVVCVHYYAVQGRVNFVAEEAGKVLE